MFTVSRSFLRSFRALQRKCVRGKSRGPAPPVMVSWHAEACVLATHMNEVILTGHIPGTVPCFDPFQLPGDLLDRVDGPGEEPVSFTLSDHGLEIGWTDRGQAQRQLIDRQPVSSKLRGPAEPNEMTEVPNEFCTALHEAGRTTGTDTGRFALNRVQIQGRTGDVIASDAVTIYWHSGFVLPFDETILIPAIPLFGATEWTKTTNRSLGRTPKHLVVRSGVWTVFLTIDRAGRFPDVKEVVPKTLSPTTFDLDPEDVRLLRDALPKLPGQRDEKQPVTLDLVPGHPAVVRGRDAQSGAVSELVLTRSPVRNGPSRVAINRAFLQRAISLNCSTIRVVGSERPVVARNDRITWLAANLHPDSIVAPATASNTCVTRESLQPITVLENRHPMKRPEQNGHPHDRAESSEVGDPLAEAEQLRASLFEATQTAGRLVALLKARKKEQKTLASVYSSLKSLNLGP